MATLKDIENLTQKYADARGALESEVKELQAELEQVRRSYVKAIAKLADRVLERRAELFAALESAPELFVKPRSLVVAGIRVGFEKGKGKVEYTDADKVVALIERHLPEQAELLVITEKKPNKQAILKLPAADVKRIGCTISGTGDAVIIKDAAGEVDKLVAALLAEDTEEAAA